MENSSAPFSLGGDKLFQTVFRSEVMPLFKYQPITMVHHCTRSFVISSFKKGGITSDRNTISNCHLLMRLGQNPFPQ